MNRRHAAALILGAALVACSRGGDASGPLETPESRAGGEGASGPTGETGEGARSLSTQTVEIFFPSAQGDGLVGEPREIFATALPGDRAKQIVADLISGPTTEVALRALPPGTELRQIYVLDGGVAYLDFSIDLQRGMGGGSAEELLAVYAIVNSVVLNVAEIERVGILIGGEPIESLNGHLDLTRPLGPNTDLIVGRDA